MLPATASLFRAAGFRLQHLVEVGLGQLHKLKELVEPIQANEVANQSREACPVR